MSDRLSLETEVQVLRDQLAQLEQEHADLVVELSEFETLYTARVGPLQAKLEEAQLHIAEYKLRIDLVRWRGSALSPGQLEAEVEYRLRDQRRYAHTIYEQAEAAQRAAANNPIDPAASLDLKQIYRELAKRTHPDLATDDLDRSAREQQMKTINALYAQRDLAALRDLFRKLHVVEDSQHESPAERALRLSQEHDRLVAAIRRVKGDVAELNHSAMMSLKLDTALGRSRQRDVLGEVAAKVQVQLNEAESQLNQLIARFLELVEANGLTN
ncbi:MAG: J domain-containing protein [Chloroflexi bacterium]|nr:J domain-containing protein [Chloroflexota bacterium]